MEGKIEKCDLISDVDSNETKLEKNRDCIGEMYEHGAPRPPKRSKSMSCLSSDILIFTDLNARSDNFTSHQDSSVKNIPLRSSTTFKRPMVPRRRVSFYDANDGGKVNKSEKESSAFEFRPSFDSVTVKDLCLSDDFLCNGFGGSFLQKSHSFCDPRLRDALAESWREML
jgi:hypothetical protein